MIDKAQRKLREAQFFYRHLLKVQGGTGGDAEAFRFYFSAFIQAARSVTWAIGKEEKKKWKAWEPKWSKGLTPDQRKLKKLTNKLRQDEKLGGADVLMELEEVAFNELLGIREYDRSHPAYYAQTQPQGQPMQQRLESPRPSPVKISRPKYYFENKGDRAEVMTVCRDYLDFLDELIKGFLSAHP